MADSPVFSNCIVAPVIKKKPAPIIISPTIILNNELDTFPFSLRLAQNRAMDVPKKIINIAFIDWNTEAGISKPIRNLLVLSAVYILIRPPACSKAPQNTITSRNDMNKTPTLSFSIFDKGLFEAALSSSFIDAPI